MLEISLALKGQPSTVLVLWKNQAIAILTENIKIVLINIRKECYRKASEEIQF